MHVHMPQTYRKLKEFTHQLLIVVTSGEGNGNGCNVAF